MLIELVDLHKRAEESEPHHLAQLALPLKHGKLLLLVQGDLIVVIAGDPGVLERCSSVISLRGRVGTQIQEEIFGESSEVRWKFPVNRISFNILHLLDESAFAGGVARVLPAG